MYLLENTLRPYAWGSTTAIAELLGRPASGGPEAELWIGAHPDSPSLALLSGGSEPLDHLIAADPGRALGPTAHDDFGGTLPFLLKVLAAHTPLSLQVHPSREQAAAGFAAEDAAGVPRDAPNRNYRDKNHKPEMILALTRFEALCGFRPAREAAAALRRVISLVQDAGMQTPAILQNTTGDLEEAGEEEAALRSAFTRILTGGEEVNAAVATVVAALGSASRTPENGPLEAAPGNADFQTVLKLNTHYPNDPGVLVALLLNRVSLAPGQAIYLPAGNVHAYLHGLGIEVMASSDNVLRGGLTPKHIDVRELLKTVNFQPLGVPYLDAGRTPLGQEVFQPPFDEFQLQRIELGSVPQDGMAGSDVPVIQNGPALVLAVDGPIVLDSPRGDLLLERGQSAFLPAYESPVIAKLGTGRNDDGATTLGFAVTLAER